METYHIKIDINSIKLNKDRGSTTTNVTGSKDIRFKSQYLPHDFIDGKNCAILSWEEDNGNKINIEGVILSEELFDQCISEKRKGIEIKVQYNNHQIKHFPIPKYSYSYKNTKIRCSGCKQDIWTDDLESEEMGGEYYSDRICPKCGEHDCCVLEYENIEDAVVRAEKMKMLN